jgi:hypothetical protein
LKLLRPLCFLGLHSPCEDELTRIVSDSITVCRRCNVKLIKKRFGKRWRVMQVGSAKKQRERR